MKRLLSTFALSLLCAVLSSKEQYIFTQISQNEGLTSAVNCIYKEKDTDVWIGTQNGLYSFNGKTVRMHDDPLVKGRRILKIHADRNNNMWILTERYLLRKSADEDHFRQMTPQDLENPFHGLCHDEEGVWFGCNDKIFRYTFSDDRFFLFSTMTDRPSFKCKYLCNMNDSTLLCGSHNGIVTIDKKTGKTSESALERYKEVSSMLVDSMGNIWIAYYNRGIEEYDKEGNFIRRYDSGNSGLSNDIILCMTENDSLIWTGSDGGGVNVIDPSSGKIHSLSHIAGDPSSFPAHSIKSIFADFYGNIWAGSIREGLINISKSGMKTYSDCHIGMNTGLSNPTVLCLHQEKDSDIVWIGTDGEGLNSFNYKTGKFTHYPSTLKKKVVSIADYSESELALSIYADRIRIFNKVTGELRPLEIHDEDINYLLKYAGRSLNLANRKDGSLLLISNRMFMLDKSSGECTAIAFDGRNAAQGNLFTIGTEDGSLWLHDNFNIYRLAEGKDRIEKIWSQDSALIRAGYLGKDSDIWLATDKGLCMFNHRDRHFQRIETSLFNETNSVVCDLDSRVWIGTDIGLYAYLSENRSFTLFGQSDGAESNEYLSKPRLLSREGDVYMGGVQGLLCIDSDYEIDETEEPEIKFDYLMVDDAPVTDLNGSTYRIPRNSKNIDVGVSVSEKDIFRNRMYRFTLSDGQAYETSNPVIHIQRLKEYGTFRISASCTKRNGEWTVPVEIVSIHLPKPWYRTWWFMSLIIAFVMMVIWNYVRYLLRQKEHRLQIAMREKDQMVYQEKVKMLINMSHELRTPLTLVIAPLKRLLKGMSEDDGNYETLSRIYRQSRRMSEMLNMVLDLRKMEVGKEQMKIEDTDFNRWILETTRDVTDEEHIEGIDIIYETDPRVGVVGIDRRKCDTVISNILMNAIKHSSKGDTVTIRTEATDEGMVRVSISDQGPGLKGIDSKRLFTRFYQNKNEQYGSGIGLSYSKILIELHGGRIGADDNVDKGATFWWEIPMKQSEESMSEVPARAYLNELIGSEGISDISAPQAGTFSTSGMTLMLVDDNQDLLDFLREAYLADFTEIMTVQSGNKALESLKYGKLPDIIVSDVNMPDGDGYRLCKEIKENEKFSHIPVILLTARGEEQSQSDSYRVGADAFLAKPFETETLLEQMRSLLKRKAEIRKKYLDTEKKTISQEYGSNEERFILQLNRIIGDHLNDPELDQQLICREMGVSRALLYNKMKAITGAGAKEYITRIRLEKAKSLIESTDLSIADISEMTGFSSQSYFSTAFKNYTGRTPSQYKQDVRSEN
ncbi:MAG: response regulator [Bacteroidales bacterium]|nr:response regulator [Bacteroidales bacterium]